MKKGFYLLTILVMACASLTVFFRAPTASAAFNANNIMDDTVFNDYNSMTAAQIDSWINSRYGAASCISTARGFMAPDVTGYSAAANRFYFGNDVSAGTIIEHSAKVYGLNPRVIITTLEKEESLISGSGTVSNPGCSKFRYAAAMGNGCDDSPSQNDYNGFELHSLPGAGTASQNGTTVTGSGTNWTTNGLAPGDILVFANGATATVNTINSSTSLTVNESRTMSAQSYRIKTMHITGTCVETAANRQPMVGFSRQVIQAVWKLKFWQQRSKGNISWNVQLTNYPHTGNVWDNSDDPASCYTLRMTEGNYKQCPSDSQPTYFDGWYPIDGESVHMNTGATAAFYNYTPHFHGNQLFVSLFENTFGFGSVYGAPAHPDGSLIKFPSDPSIYLLKDGVLHKIVALSIFNSYRYSFSDVKGANSSENILAYGTPVNYLRPGTIFKGSGPTIYVLVMVSGQPQKQAFASWSDFTKLGYSLSDVQTIPENELSWYPQTASPAPNNRHPDGTLIKTPDSPKVYLIENGVRRWVQTYQIFQSHNFNSGSIKTATAADMNLTGWVPTAFNEGTLMKLSDKPYIFVVDYDGAGNVRKRFINSGVCFDRLGLKYADVITVPSSTYGLNQGMPSADGPDLAC